MKRKIILLACVRILRRFLVVFCECGLCSASAWSIGPISQKWNLYAWNRMNFREIDRKKYFLLSNAYWYMGILKKMWKQEQRTFTQNKRILSWNVFHLVDEMNFNYLLISLYQPYDMQLVGKCTQVWFLEKRKIKW